MSYRPGDYYLICDECGFKTRRSEAQHRWDRLLVCKLCWEPRHPQDFVRGQRDRQTVPDARPEPPDRFLEVGDVTPESL